MFELISRRWIIAARSHSKSARTNLWNLRSHLRPLSIGNERSRVEFSSVASPSSSYGLYRLLSPHERKLLEEQRELTKISRELASKVEATAKASSREKSMLLTSQQYSSRNFLDELQLDATFSVVIAGEFNAGKSTLINALLGSKLLETGALPTTDSITVVTAIKSDSPVDAAVIESDDSKNLSRETPSTSSSLMLGVVLHTVENLPLLEDLTLIDTPGTNSAWMDHTERTKKMLPAADLILFVTSADRPFSDSERNLLQSIQAYRKNIVVIINKMDILEISGGSYGQEQKDAILDFVTDKASELLGARPVVIPISARDALSAKLMGKKQSFDSAQTNVDDRSAVWHRSNFTALESFLKESLTTQAKLRSKLSNPIGVAEGVMEECLQVLKEQREDLQADIATLSVFQSQFEGWKKELEADLLRSQTTMADMVQQEGQRCDILLNRMGLLDFYLWTLYDKERLEEEWSVTKREVSVHRQHDEDLRADLLEHVLETADSVATRGRAQGQAVIEYLGKRPAVKNNQSLVGSVTTVSRFEETRKNLLEKLSHAVEDTFRGRGSDDLDKDRLFSSLKQTAILSASLTMSSLGSGILLALQGIDALQGYVITASLFAGGGASFFVGKAKIKDTYNEEWSRRAQHLRTAIDAIANKELEKVNRKILDGVAPYTRFVETEKERIADLQESCERVASGSRNLRNRIQKLR